MENIYKVPATSCSDSDHRIFWARVMSDQKASGISIKKFCHQHQLNFSALHYWKYKKQKIKATNSHNDRNVQRPQSNNNATKFIPLQISTSTPVSDHHKIESNKTSEIQIVFKNNHKLILPSTTPEASLLLVIKAVAGLQC
jgi:hypothetical protein